MCQPNYNVPANLLGKACTILLIDEDLISWYSTSEFAKAIKPMLASNENSMILMVSKRQKDLKWDPIFNRNCDR